MGRPLDPNYMRFDTSALEELEERFRNFQKRIPEECEKEALLRDEYASSITKEDVKRAFMIKLLLPVKKSRWKQISLIVGSSFLGAFVKYAADRNIISEDIELLYIGVLLVGVMLIGWGIS